MKLASNIIFIFLLFSSSSFSQIPSFKVTVCDSSASKGYYFLSTTKSLAILDRYGSTIYYKPGNNLSNFTLQPNGVMTYHAGSKFFLMDSTFKVIDSIQCKNVPVTNYHDLRILNNGHFLLLGTDTMNMDLSRYPFWKNKTDNPVAKVLHTVVQEQDAKRKVVFEWHAKDYYAIDDPDTFFIPRSQLFVWTHTNAVEMDNDGNILISNRNFNEITKISHSDGSIMWRLGGKQNEFKFVNCPVPFYGQHDVRRIGNGNVTVFDNGNHVWPHGARALEFKLDEKNKIATLVWSFTLDSALYSTRQGNVQRLENSNTLINYGNTVGDTANHVGFIVVNSAGSKIFEVDEMNSYRVLNYTSLPWQLHFPSVSCNESDGKTYLEAATGYKSYQWNTGDTTRSIPVTKRGIYNVFLPDGHGGYIRSEQIIVEDISNPCKAIADAKRKK